MNYKFIEEELLEKIKRYVNNKPEYRWACSACGCITRDIYSNQRCEFCNKK